VIEVVFNRGIHLPEVDFWLDPWDAKESAFVSHAHADHFAGHGNALCSTLTAKLLRARFNMAEARLEGVDFGQIIDRNGFRLRMLPAGHIAGSAMLHVTRKKDGATLLYTGDFKARRGRTTEQVNFLQADTLIMETTFGLPHLVFPSAMEVDASVLRFVQDALADGETPVLFGYSLGKAQEALALLAEHGIPALSHPKVAEMTEVCRAAGIWLPEPRIFEGFTVEGHVVVAPPNAVSSKLLRGLKSKRTAMLTGWALQPGSLYRYRVDEVIPMSDHADHAGLHECITRVRPKRVLTVHGYAKEFAAELRAKGIDAWCAMGGDQLELSLGKSHSSAVGAATPRHSRPICQLADFSDVCRLIGETSSRLAKIDYLVGYLRGLNGEDLETATRWLTGEALPRRAGRRSLNVGSATIKRALVSVPGVKPERYQEISAVQNDIARTGRILLQEVSLSPKPMEINDLRSFFMEIDEMDGSLDKVEVLAKRLFDLHPSEGELVIKLLTGDLRIGLKEGLVEEAISQSFQANDLDLRQANMLTGDLGRTAVLAKEGRLPGERIVTAGGQYRYACTPEMLRWMRLMRTRHRGGLMPPSSLVFRRFRPRSSAAVGRDRGVAIWEIDCLLEEVDERIVEVLSMGPPPTAEEYTSLLQCLRPAVLGLAKREATITKLMSHVPSATAQPKGKSKRSGPLPPVKEARSRTTREPGLE
jgi:DNA ligase-1